MGQLQRALYLAGEAHLIAGAVLSNVLGVGLRQLLNGFIDGLHAAWHPHGLRGEIGVTTGTCMQR